MYNHHMNMLRPKVTVVGAGNVGTRFIYALMIKGLARQIVLVDLNKDRAEGEVMDLGHGAPYVPSVEVIAGDYPDIKGSDLVVITAGRRQQPGQTRMDLAKDNVELFRKLIPEIVKQAPEAVLLVVANPVDILSYAAYKFSGKPASSVIGSGTVLDSARFRYEIAQHCNIDPHNIHAYILGEHGDTEFPAWSRVVIGGTLMKDYCIFCRRNHSCDRGMIQDDIFEQVRGSAYKIIQKKGETSYGIGLALTRITQAILRDENSVLPVSSLIEDFNGVKDVYLSLPAVINKGGIRELLKIELADEEMIAFKRSAESLKEVIRQVGL
jgi:L-lactate dehydrogenase